ncbi:M23 family metallopeptidase [Halorhodospira halochloris]|uniref:Peptidase n=1 Tax=Halorhodospira halochloris TaxID=1052 RepID=A0A0X8XB92_HALHR|nr:M23 family metallopeptidase [Halorhodospira halochloris]MBK1652169.1 peptidase M23 [Halorhodospira halochloris]MCG5530598.1 M23 family metallopeptidase [Halorhodospira halochloris]BAU58412.1 peptidase [Halorhodospira halochloris]
MKDRFTVTISDFRGAKHYSLHQIVKRFALAVLFLVLTIVLGGAGAIYGLNMQIEELNTIRADKAHLAKQIEQRNNELRNILSQREQEINRMDLELSHIESLVGLEPSPETDRHERLDTASQTALEKALMLRTIPNGWPLKEETRITSGYGWRNHPVTGERSFHAAVDMRAPVGRKVTATADGVVNYAAKHRGSGLGNLVILDHDFGFRTHYAHLSEFKVEQGEFVEKGEVIALSGATGNVNGPHLHYEIWHLQRKLNPEPFLDWSLSNYDELFEKEGRVKWESLAKGISQRAQVLERQLSAMGHDSSEN